MRNGSNQSLRGWGLGKILASSPGPLGAWPGDEANKIHALGQIIKMATSLDAGPSLEDILSRYELNEKDLKGECENGRPFP